MAVTVPLFSKVPPTHGAFVGARCPVCDGPLEPHGKILRCPACSAAGGHKAGHFYPRRCNRYGCRALFVTRHFHQFYCPVHTKARHR